MTNFTKLLELFPDLEFSEDGTWLPTHGVYDYINDHTEEVPYLIKAYLQAKKRIMFLEDTDTRDATIKDLSETLDGERKARSNLQERHNNFIRALQNV